MEEMITGTAEQSEEPKSPLGDGGEQTKAAGRDGLLFGITLKSPVGLSQISLKAQHSVPAFIIKGCPKKTAFRLWRTALLYTPAVAISSTH